MNASYLILRAGEEMTDTCNDLETMLSARLRARSVSLLDDVVRFIRRYHVGDLGVHTAIDPIDTPFDLRAEVLHLMRDIVEKSPHADDVGPTMIRLGSALKLRADLVLSSRRADLELLEYLKLFYPVTTLSVGEYLPELVESIDTESPEDLLDQAKLLAINAQIRYAKKRMYYSFLGHAGRLEKRLETTVRRAEDLLLFQLGHLTVGKKIASKCFSDQHGNEISLDQECDSPTLVDIWKSSCAPCVEKLESLSELVEEKSPQELRVVTICTDREESEMIEFLNRFPYPNLIHCHIGQNRTMIREFHIRAYPSILIVDKEGNLFARGANLPSGAVKHSVQVLGCS